jgi:hypothetical protein
MSCPLAALRDPVLPEGVTTELEEGCVYLVYEGEREVRIEDRDLSVSLVEREAWRIVGSVPC